MKKHYKAVLAATALIAACALVATLVIFRSSDDRPTLKHVVVNQAFEHLLYIPLYVAKDKGFFADEGLDVAIHTGGGDAQAFAALASGNADFAQGDPAFVAIAEQQGWDGRVVAMAVNRAAIWGVTLDESIEPFDDPAGFRGRTVATYPEPNTSYVVQKELVLDSGLTLGEETSILQVPFGTELAAIRSRNADIAHTIEPNASQVELQGGRVVFSYPDAYGPLAFTGVMTSQRLIEEDPETVQRFVNAFERSLQLIATHPDEALEVAHSRLPAVDREVLRRALQRLVDSESLPSHAEVEPKSWKKLLEIRLQVGDLKQMPTKSLVDNSFARAARGN